MPRCPLRTQGATSRQDREIPARERRQLCTYAHNRFSAYPVASANDGSTRGKDRPSRAPCGSQAAYSWFRTCRTRATAVDDSAAVHGTDRVCTTGSMSSVRLCSAGRPRATSPLLSARSTRWALRIIARHANACQAHGRRGSHEWMLHRCGACDDAARLENRPCVGGGALKTCLDADLNRWPNCCRIAHADRPELGSSAEIMFSRSRPDRPLCRQKTRCRPAAEHNRTLNIEAGLEPPLASVALVANLARLVLADSLQAIRWKRKSAARSSWLPLLGTFGMVSTGAITLRFAMIASATPGAESPFDGVSGRFRIGPKRRRLALPATLL